MVQFRVLCLPGRIHLYTRTRICGLGFNSLSTRGSCGGVAVAGWGGTPHSLPALLCLDKAKSSKVNTIIMFCIAGGILVAILVLMGVVICLYYKVANALK